jgi:hypothetical protein
MAILSMRCIFCLEERPGSEEHIFPLAIGGCITTNRVCEACNSLLGSRVDAALSDFFPVRTRRAELGLAGNSGTPPPKYEMLLGVAKLAEYPGRRVQTMINKDTGKLDIRALHHASDVVMPDGSKGRQIIIDERDIGELPKIIQRERKRHGVPPLSDEQLAAEVLKASQNIVRIDNPAVHIELSVSFAYLRHAMMKIAYELAFLWLGESYLDDPSAVELRAAICAPDVASTDEIPGYVGDAGGCDAFKHWTEDKNHHIAFAMVGNGGIGLAIRVFDIYAAIVWITKDAARYLTGGDLNSVLRFLSIEPVSGKIRNVPFNEELARIAIAIVEAQRATYSETTSE